MWRASLPSAGGESRDVAGRRVEVEIWTSPRLEYAVTFAGKPLLLRSRLGLTLKGGPTLSENLAITGSKTASIDQSWECRLGKASRIVDRCNELRLALAETAGQQRKFDLVFRAYNDGVAFRYALPRQPGLEQFILNRDESQFRFPGNPTVWAADYGGFVSSQEGEFSKWGLWPDLSPGQRSVCHCWSRSRPTPTLRSP